MVNSNQIDDRTSDGVNLLITILMRFPQIGTVHYDPKNRTLRLTFIVQSYLDPNEFVVLQQRTLDCLAAYHRLIASKPSTISVEYQSSVPFSIVSLTRDLASITRGEIGLFITLLTEEFKEHLVMEIPVGLDIPDDPGLTDEWIDSMIDNVRQNKSKKKLTALREDGRVLVFNK